MPIHVNVDDFVRAETHRMFSDIQASAGGVEVFRHNSTPARIEEQTVIRLDRNTLYSFAIVDLAQPAQLVLPDPRPVSVGDDCQRRPLREQRLPSTR